MRFSSEQYVPNYLDVTYSQKNETNTTESLVTVNYCSYYLTDIGSCQQERRHWKKALKEVDTLIYIIPLDIQESKMKEYITEYSKTIQGEWFKTTKILVVFNKEDQLSQNEKIEKKKMFKKFFVDKYNECYRISYVFGSCLDGNLVIDIFEELNLMGRENRLSESEFDVSKIPLTISDDFKKIKTRKSYENSPKRKSFNVWFGGKLIQSKSFSDVLRDLKLDKNNEKEDSNNTPKSRKSQKFTSFTQKRQNSNDDLDQFFISEVKSLDTDPKYNFTPEPMKISKLKESKNQNLSKVKSFFEQIFKNPKKRDLLKQEK